MLEVIAKVFKKGIAASLAMTNGVLIQIPCPGAVADIFPLSGFKLYTLLQLAQVKDVLVQ